MADLDERFRELEEKLLRAIELFKQTRAEKLSLQAEMEKLRMSSKDRARGYETLERELHTLRREREEVRNRIEKLLEQIDVLTKPDSAG